MVEFLDTPKEPIKSKKKSNLDTLEYQAPKSHPLFKNPSINFQKKKSFFGWKISRISTCDEKKEIPTSRLRSQPIRGHPSIFSFSLIY